MPIKTIGVIGAGTIGPGIAYEAAFSGYATILEGVSQERLEDGMAYIRRMLRSGVGAGTVTTEQAQETLARLALSRSVEDVCRQADLLIEATQEELEVKLEIFTLFDKFAKPEAILASSSRAVPISDLAEITFRTESCVGLRFGAPPRHSRSLEIVRTRDTSDAVVHSCIEVGQRMRREVVLSRE
jgi:3-hydroxyacyl-CoA dehydrogenase